MIYEIETTVEFDRWLKQLRDRDAVQAIGLRMTRASNGNFGDVEPVGNGISEMRIFVGKGYRLYFTVRDGRVVILLNGGIKSNKKQQQIDIKKAKSILAQLE